MMRGGRGGTSRTLCVTRYFAYGSNMDEARMAVRCRGARVFTTAELPGHRFIIGASGYATVVPDPEHTVWGILWLLTEKDEDALDWYEDLENGLYRKTDLRVATPAGELNAMVYLASDAREGTPRKRYIENIVQAAKKHKFPKTYLTEIKTFLKPQT